MNFLPKTSRKSKRKVSGKKHKCIIEDSVLKSIYTCVVKEGDGKPTGHKEERLNYHNKIMKTLSEHLVGFKQDIYSTIYVPPLYPLEGFEYHLIPIINTIINVDNKPEKIYTIFASLLRELQELRDPLYTEGLEKAALKCIEAAKPIYGEKVYSFVNKYVNLNKTILIDITRKLIENNSIAGCTNAIKEVLKEETYSEIYMLCKDIRLGKNETDKFSKRITGLGRTYDGVLIFLGVASNYEIAKDIRFKERQYRSYLLQRTPFTRAFINVMLRNIQVEDYVEAYKDFIECVVKTYPNSAEYIASYCGELLNNKWRHIGVESEYYLNKNIIKALYAMINELSSKIFH